ncbi:MAG TPA: helix-turn-helix transcriptional regulator [Holophagaceae bacterium]|nr:helix-turn-helix transcriptional regulator [Holophagaceae bacterium]
MPGLGLLGGVLLAISLLLTMDLVWDRIQGRVGFFHLALEGLAGAASLVLGLRLLRALRRKGRSIARLELALRASQEEARRWRGEAAQVLQGLGAALDHQFGRWQLSPAEREVALLLLKGFSTRDIAGMRDTSERTVRQQAQDVYRKAGLSGRAELSAFFLEDLFLPPTHG